MPCSVPIMLILDILNTLLNRAIGRMFLAAGGVLVAAKEQWVGNELQPSTPRDALESIPLLMGTDGDHISK